MIAHAGFSSAGFFRVGLEPANSRETIHSIGVQYACISIRRGAPVVELAVPSEGPCVPDVDLICVGDARRCLLRSEPRELFTDGEGSGKSWSVVGHVGGHNVLPTARLRFVRIEHVLLVAICVGDGEKRRRVLEIVPLHRTASVVDDDVEERKEGDVRLGIVSSLEEGGDDQWFAGAAAGAASVSSGQGSGLPWPFAILRASREPCGFALATREGRRACRLVLARPSVTPGVDVHGAFVFPMGEEGEVILVESEDKDTDSITPSSAALCLVVAVQLEMEETIRVLPEKDSELKSHIHVIDSWSAPVGTATLEAPFALAIPDDLPPNGDIAVVQVSWRLRCAVVVARGTTDTGAPLTETLEFRVPLSVVPPSVRLQGTDKAIVDSIESDTYPTLFPHDTLLLAAPGTQQPIHLKP